MVDNSNTAVTVRNPLLMVGLNWPWTGTGNTIVLTGDEIRVLAAAVNMTPAAYIEHLQKAS